MIYKKKEEKEAIKRALSAFMATNGTSISKAGSEMGLNANSVWQKLNRGSVDTEFVDKLIKHVDKKFSLQKFGSTFMVSKG